MSGECTVLSAAVRYQALETTLVAGWFSAKGWAMGNGYCEPVRGGCFSGYVPEFGERLVELGQCHIKPVAHSTKPPITVGENRFVLSEPLYGPSRY